MTDYFVNHAVTMKNINHHYPSRVDVKKDSVHCCVDVCIY